MGAFLLDGVIRVPRLASLPVDPDAPTQAELGAGTNMVGTKQTEELIGIDGWEKQPTSIPLPGYAGTEVGTLAGEQSYPESTLTWRKDNASEVIYAAAGETTTLHWMYFAQDGLASGNEAEGFPVTIASRERSKQRNVPNSFTSSYSLSPPYKATQAA